MRPFLIAVFGLLAFTVSDSFAASTRTITADAIKPTQTNGNITLTPNGSGKVATSKALLFTGAATFSAPASNGTAAIGAYNTADGLTMAGKGSSTDFLLLNAALSVIASVNTGTTQFDMAGNATVGGTLNVTGVITGPGSGLTTLNGTNISSGTVAAARGGSGISNAGTFTWGSNNITVTTSGTTSITLPTSGTMATLAGAETLSSKTLTSPIISTISNTGTLTLPTSTDTLMGRATTDTVTNKSVSTGGTNSIGATAISGVTGSGSVVFATSPQFTQSVGIGAAATSSDGLVINAGGGNVEGLATTGTFSSTSVQMGVDVGNTFNATSLAYGLNTTMTIAAGVTVPTAVGLFTGNFSLLSAAAITTAYGIKVNNVTAGGTNYSIFTGSGVVSLGDTTDASSSTLAGVVMAGGLGIAKKLNVGTSATVGTTLLVTGAATFSSDTTINSSLGSGFARVKANANTFTLANNATTTFVTGSSSAGYLFVTESNHGATAQFGVDYAGTVRLIDGDSGFWSITDGTASRVSVSMASGGTIKFNNKQGSTLVFSAAYLQLF